ncbi:hypothetical protein MHU86_14546 [Fragilaria crotonensis]|nr:hypothetical protein MHU86_14546 [Fragilaria crotonensis]
MSSSAGKRGSNQGGGSRDHGHGKGAGPPNAAPVTVRGQSSNWQGKGSPSPSGDSQMIRRSQAATLSPSRTRSQQDAATLSPMIMTRSQTAALSPMIMTRSQAVTAGRHAGFTNPGSGVGGMSGRSQQERQQVRRQQEQRYLQRLQERFQEQQQRQQVQQQTPPAATTIGREDDIARDLEFTHANWCKKPQREDSSRTALTKRFMASKLQIEGEDEVKTWWDGVKKHVNDALKRHRNNVIKTIKQLFRDKILGRDGYAVTFELNQIAGMRSPASKERYIDFLDCLVKAVVGYSKYMENRTRQPLSQWFTLTDEAFLMVCIESYMTKWRHDWMVQRMGPPATMPPRDSSPQLYEARYTGKTYGTKRSWSKEGLERFNALMIDVFRNRQEHGAAFDADFLEEMKFRYASGIDAASGQSGEEAEVIPVATVQPTIVYNDFNMELLLAHANITGGAGMNGEQQPDDGVRGVSV